MPLTHYDLREWGESLDSVQPHGMGNTLVEYADAWRSSLNAKREACAVLCDEIANATEPDDFALDAVNEAASAIRTMDDDK